MLNSFWLLIKDAGVALLKQTLTWYTEIKSGKDLFKIWHGLFICYLFCQYLLSANYVLGASMYVGVQMI